MIRKQYFFPFITAFLIGLSTAFAPSDANSSPDEGRELADGSYVVHSRPALPKGNRELSIDVNVRADESYEASFIKVKGIGVQSTALPLNWDQLEPTNGQWNNQILTIAKTYYPTRNISLALHLRPIDTNGKHFPADLSALPFDSPMLISRFKSFVDRTLLDLNGVSFSLITVGNEVDVGLGSDEVAWTQYKNFLNSIIPYLKSKSAKPVGFTATFNGLMNKTALLAPLVPIEDAVFMTYYPLNSNFHVRAPESPVTDIPAVLSVYGQKQLFIVEAGYPTSPVLDSNGFMQASFIGELFKAWDANASRIPYIHIVWLNDLNIEQVEALSSYYGSYNSGFREYLRTLGLRTAVRSDKLGMEALDKEAGARGWNANYPYLRNIPSPPQNLRLLENQ